MHLFRVTFSTDIDEYYKSSPNDITVSLTVDARNFDDAMISAKGTISELVRWPDDFEIVSMAKLDDTIESFADRVDDATLIGLISLPIE